MNQPKEPDRDFGSTACSGSVVKKNIPCVVCGNVFVSRFRKDRGWSKYCSRKCWTEERNPAKTMLCKHCGKEFVSRMKRGKYQELCGVECANENAKTGEWVACVVCGIEHWKERNRIERNANNYCSLECRNTGKREELCGASWHGGTVIHSSGYEMDATHRIDVKQKGHNTRLHYVGKHRLVVEGIIGRKLRSDEAVLHVNRDKNDLRPDNLCVVSMDEMWRLAGSGGWVNVSNLEQYQ